MKIKVWFFQILLFFVSSFVFSDPVSISLQTIPLRNGGSIAGEIAYSWDEKTSSKIRFDYSSSSTLDLSLSGFENSHQVVDLQNFQLDALPYVFCFPSRSFSISFSLGVSYLFLSESIDSIMQDTNGYLLSPAGQYVTYKSNRQASIFAPSIGLEFFYKANENFAICYEGCYNPIYFLSLHQNARYDFIPKDFTNNLYRWSTPIIDNYLYIDLFKFFRLAFFYSFQRLNFQTMDWNQDGSSLVGVDDIQLISKARIGLEILIPTSGNRIKATGGFYWQWVTNNSSYWSVLVDTSKPLFMIGSYNI